MINVTHTIGMLFLNYYNEHNETSVKFRNLVPKVILLFTEISTLRKTKRWSSKLTDSFLH